MKKYLKALRVANYAWLVFVFLILILATLPAIPGNVQIKLPGAGGWTTTESGGVINITGNVSIYNGGFFPLDNFYFDIMLYDTDFVPIAEFLSPSISLPPGTWSVLPVSFNFQDSAAVSTELQTLFFSTATFTGMVVFNANYIFQFNIQAVVIGDVSMGPLIHDWQFHANETQVRVLDKDYLLDIPYDVDASFFLMGSPLWYNGTVSNETQVLGDFSTTADLGGFTNGNLSVVLSEESYRHLHESSDTLYFNGTMAFGPYRWLQNFTVPWTPPASQESANIEVALIPGGRVE
jgi:hypothetical protein